MTVAGITKWIEHTIHRVHSYNWFKFEDLPSTGLDSGECQKVSNLIGKYFRCFMYFVLDPASVHGPKPKHTRLLPPSGWKAVCMPCPVGKFIPFFLKHIMPNDLCLRINDILTRVRFHYLFTHYSWCVCVNSLVQFLPAVRYKYRGQWIIFGLLISASFQKNCPIQQYIGQRSTGT